MNLIKKDPKKYYSLKRWTEQHGRLCISQNVAQECRENTNYICDLFKIPVSTVTVDSEDDLWLLDFAQQRQEQKLKKVHALRNNNVYVRAELYSRILKCNATESLTCEMFPPDGYRFNGKLPAVSNLVVRYGFWITRKHLLGLDASYAGFYRAELRSADMSALLRCWLNGGLPNLKCLRISLRTAISIEEIDESIRDRFERVQGEITYKRTHFDLGVEFDSINAFHLRKEDKVVATVQFGHLFWMVVWPDFSGKRV